jgi:hypothetical protein
MAKVSHTVINKVIFLFKGIGVMKEFLVCQLELGNHSSSSVITIITAFLVILAVYCTDTLKNTKQKYKTCSYKK